MDGMDDVFKLEALQSESLKNAEIEKEVIVDIYRDYLENQEMLKRQAEYFGSILNLDKEINSVKWRVKDPIHLLTKIVRKRKEAIACRKEPDYNEEAFPYLNINADNYKTIVNDLVGIRAIYLFKANWNAVNSYVLKNFNVSKAEKIKIYHTEDDDLSFYNPSPDYQYTFGVKGSRYRSTHYIIKGVSPHDFKFELQTRTILDEAWSEIDHRIRYPDFEKHEELQRKMSVLNGSISGCEELASRFFEDFKTLEISMLADNKNKLLDEQDSQRVPRKATDSVSNIENLDARYEMSDQAWDAIIKKAGISLERDRYLKVFEETKRDLNFLEPLFKDKNYLEVFKNYKIDKPVYGSPLSDILQNINALKSSLPTNLAEEIAKKNRDIFKNNNDNENDDSN